MSALAHWFETAGIATVAIVPIRLHAERMRPPRALWVPFELGRPLGVPGDAVFQRRVLDAALALLDRRSGPVLVDYGEDAPGSGESDEGFVCPVSFPPADTGPPGLVDAVADEVRRLRPWFDIARTSRGRSTFGASGLEPEELPEALARVAEGEAPVIRRTAVHPAQALKHLADDLSAFYQEAATARPDGAAGSRAVLAWFWTNTRAAELLLAAAGAAAQADDPLLARTAARNIVPQAVSHLVEGPQDGR